MWQIKMSDFSFEKTDVICELKNVLHKRTFEEIRRAHELQYRFIFDHNYNEILRRLEAVEGLLKLYRDERIPPPPANIKPPSSQTPQKIITNWKDKTKKKQAGIKF